MRLRDGRRFDYLRQGAARGAPVLVLHTIGYGAQLMAAAHQYADAKGLSIISPLRAGHAYSDPAPEGDAQALLDQASDDMAALLDLLGISRVRIIGHAAGATHAIRFASRYPERADAIVMIARGPVWRNEWLSELSPNHRALALVLRHLPGAARLIIGAIIQHLNKNGPRDFVVNAAQESPPDVAALADPDVLHLIGHGLTFGLRQGPEVYCREFAQMQLDLTEEARALACPLTLIYGAQDRIAPPVLARRFAAAVPQTQLIELADAGHYLFYSHWREMLDAVADAG
jgi:pimeloyl-ACP methyl ester carboxylesterase